MKHKTSIKGNTCFLFLRSYRYRILLTISWPFFVYFNLFKDHKSRQVCLSPHVIESTATLAIKKLSCLTWRERAISVIFSIILKSHPTSTNVDYSLTSSKYRQWHAHHYHHQPFSSSTKLSNQDRSTSTHSWTLLHHRTQDFVAFQRSN